MFSCESQTASWSSQNGFFDFSRTLLSPFSLRTRVTHGFTKELRPSPSPSPQNVPSSRPTRDPLPSWFSPRTNHALELKPASVSTLTVSSICSAASFLPHVRDRNRPGRSLRTLKPSGGRSHLPAGLRRPHPAGSELSSGCHGRQSGGERQTRTQYGRHRLTRAKSLSSSDNRKRYSLGRDDS